MTRRNSAASISWTGEKTETIALLIHTSIGPSLSSMEAAAASTACVIAHVRRVDGRRTAQILYLRGCGVERSLIPRD